MATPVPAALLAAAPRLRFIQKLGAGVDRIDLDVCRERGIGVARLQAGNSIPVAEHTLLLMLAACRRLPLLDRQTRAGQWDREAARGVNRQIHGMTRSEEHTSELQSLMRISYAVFCLKKKKTH